MSENAVQSSGEQQVQVVLPAVIDGMLQYTFLSAWLHESQLCKLTLRMVAAFFTLASFIHNPMNQQSLTENQILILWRISCIFTAIQLALMCRLMFAVALHIQLLFDLPAWICNAFASVFNFPDSTDMCYFSVTLIFVVASCLIFHALWDDAFRFYDRNSVFLIRIWLCAGAVFMLATFCPETCRTLFEYATMVICWFSNAGAFLILFVLRLVGICFGIDAVSAITLCSHGANYGNFLHELAACSVVIINITRQIFSSVDFQQFQLYKFAGTAFAIFVSVLHYSENHQNKTGSEILLSWSMSCFFTALQLALSCWLIFMTGPGIRFVFDWAAWVCDTFGSVFSYLVGTVASYVLVMVIFVFAVAHVSRALRINEFRLTDACIVELRKLWVYIWIALTAIICTESCGRLIQYVTVTIYWFDIAAGVLLSYLVQLIAICLGVGGIILSVASIYFAMQQLSDKTRLGTSDGNLQETVR